MSGETTLLGIQLDIVYQLPNSIKGFIIIFIIYSLK